MIHVEEKDSAAVAWIKAVNHPYGDRYRLLTADISLVGRSGRGELFGCFDGIGGAPLGMQASQAMADSLIRFYREPEHYLGTWEGLRKLLLETNQEIHEWGFIPGTDRPLGGCAGTVAWRNGEKLFVFHAGDTEGLLLRGPEMTRLTRIHEVNGCLHKYFGSGPGLEVDVKHFELKAGDRILLLSDGVTKVFQLPEAVQVIQSFDDPAEAARELALRARGKRSPDDITVVLIEVPEI